MNNVVLIGRLTRDPELRHTQEGSQVARFSLAVDRGLSKEKKADMEQRGVPTADFINITVWGAQAVNCANYLVKGRLVAIQGRIQTGSYEKDGVRRYTTDVVANNVQFLEWGDKKDDQTKAYSDPFGSQSAPKTESSEFENMNFHSSDDDIPF